MDNQEANQESAEQTDPVEISNDEDSKIISSDLKELIQFLKDNKIEADELAEAEKQIQIETENQKNELAEQEQIKFLEEKEVSDKKEQEILEAEIEFRENLLTDLKDTNLKLDEVLTYNSKSDGFSDDVALVSQKMDLIIENTEHSDIQETNDNIASFADVSIIALVVIVLPIYVVYRFFKAILGNFLSAVI